MILSSGNEVRLPGIYRRIKDHVYDLLYILSISDSLISMNPQNIPDQEILRRIHQWAHIVSQEFAKKSKSSEAYEISYDALMTLFNQSLNTSENETINEKIMRCKFCKLLSR